MRRQHPNPKTEAFRAVLPEILLLSVLFALAIAAILKSHSVADASEVRVESGDDPPCAVIDKFGGTIQVLNSKRDSVQDVLRESAISCGSSVSVIGHGWARLKLRNGFDVHLGSNTFIKFSDSTEDERDDHLILFRGQIYSQTGSGTGELRILTSNSRIRASRAQLLAIFQQQDEETQLVTLSGEATLENRHEPSRKMLVKPGEISALNFHLLRTVPSAPRVVSVADLKPRLGDLHFEEADKHHVLQTIKKRLDRKFASSWPAVVEDENKVQKDEQSASVSKYARHPSDAQTSELKDHLIRRTVGDQADGEQIIFPGEVRARSEKAQLEVIDPSDQMKKKESKMEDLEKKRLIEEISKIRPE